MSSDDRNSTNTGGEENDRDVDWLRYGLGNAENRRPSRTESSGYEELGPEMYQTGTNELFAQEFVNIIQNNSTNYHFKL
jgi:potassium/chloride transporter 8